VPLKRGFAALGGAFMDTETAALTHFRISPNAGSQSNFREYLCIMANETQNEYRRMDLHSNHKYQPPSYFWLLDFLELLNTLEMTPTGMASWTNGSNGTKIK
jgi:hypothetical protein